MPNRLLREGILTSERIAMLGWAEETFYRRLMSVVDDFGCYYANPTLLRAACYPLQLDKVSDADIGKWLACVQKAALVSVYPAPDGKRYLKLLDFRQQVRAVKSRFPQPQSVAEKSQADAQHLPADDRELHRSCVADAQHLPADAHLDVVEDVDDKRTPQPPKGGQTESDIEDDKSPGALTFKAWTKALKAKGEKAIPADDPVFRYCDEVGIPHEFLAYHWHEFKTRYLQVSKRQRDWRAHFRNSVRGNWMHVWSMPNGSEVRLTTVGEQARRAIEALEHREAA